MRSISPTKAATSVGIVVGLYHLIWVTLVALGWAKPFMDFVLRLHFVSLQYAVEPFVFSTAAALVALTFSFGAFFGLIFALAWNWLTAEKSEPARPQAAAQA